MLMIRLLATAALILFWFPPGLEHGVLSAQETVSPVGLESLVLRYRIYKYATLPDADRKTLMDGIEEYVRQHVFRQKIKVARLEHEYETWFATGYYQWQWQVDDSPMTLIRIGGNWSFQGEKMAMNVDSGNCLMASLEFPEFSMARHKPFTPAMAKIVDFEIIDCGDFAYGEGDYRTPTRPGYVEQKYWTAEALGVSIIERYGTLDIDRLAKIISQIPLDQPLL